MGTPVASAAAADDVAAASALPATAVTCDPPSGWGGTAGCQGGRSTSSGHSGSEGIGERLLDVSMGRVVGVDRGPVCAESDARPGGGGGRGSCAEPGTAGTQCGRGGADGGGGGGSEGGDTGTMGSSGEVCRASARTGGVVGVGKPRMIEGRGDDVVGTLGTTWVERREKRKSLRAAVPEGSGAQIIEDFEIRSVRGPGRPGVRSVRHGDEFRNAVVLVFWDIFYLRVVDYTRLGASVRRWE